MWKPLNGWDRRLRRLLRPDLAQLRRPRVRDADTPLPTGLVGGDPAPPSLDGCTSARCRCRRRLMTRTYPYAVRVDSACLEVAGAVATAPVAGSTAARARCGRMAFFADWIAPVENRGQVEYSLLEVGRQSAAAA